MTDKVIFPAIHALQALKSTSYKNSAYALSEIVDNSYEANAKNIHVAIICDDVDMNKTATVAILDDGNGMDSEMLQRAVQYGNGSHADEDVTQIKGLGRFGVGLLSATFNQCNSLEVWSWQNGISNSTAPKIALNIPDIQKNKLNFIPEPQNESLPEFYEKVFGDFPGIHDNLPSGTLVVWRHFHGLTWVKAETLRRKIAFECGRIYRNFIAKKKIKIVLSVWSSDYHKSKITPVGIVDPMFLLAWDDRQLLPKGYGLGPFANKPMFVPFSGWHGDDGRDEEGNVIPQSYEVIDDADGKLIGCYRILASHRSPEVLEEAEKISGFNKDPGGTSFGRVARELEGVSVLRAGREIMLDAKWLRTDTSVDRWISVSIDFDPSLDEYFGVKNNKQDASYLEGLSRLRRQEEDTLAETAKNEIVLKVAKEIHELLAKMRRVIKKQRENVRPNPTNDEPVFQDPVSVQVKELLNLQKQAEPWAKKHPIRSDTGDPLQDKELEAKYERTFFNGQKAEKVRPPIVKKHGLRVDFVSEPEGGAAFFKVAESGSVMIIKLNEDHPIYNRMADVLSQLQNHDDERENDTPNLDAVKAIWLLKKMLYCYARAEREATGKQRDEFEAVRLAWGRIAKVVLEEESDD